MITYVRNYDCKRRWMMKTFGELYESLWAEHSLKKDRE